MPASVSFEDDAAIADAPESNDRADSPLPTAGATFGQAGVPQPNANAAASADTDAKANADANADADADADADAESTGDDARAPPSPSIWYVCRTVRDVLELLIPWLVSTAFLFLVVIWDERRMAKRDDPRLERAWPPAGRDSAIVGFGLIAVPVHFIRTRRSLLGVALALAWTLAAILVEVIATLGLDAVLNPGTDAQVAERLAMLAASR
jgi:hypothetical protein